MTLGPSAGIQFESNPLGFVTQDKAQKFARPDSLFFVHFD